ncbi:carotenoid 1,2-hydratase [Myxococcota bacterium]|nr:carotenoid 1,2-hydratase [Myxococcota bacterium]
MAARPAFDLEIPPGGYAWWYLDATGEDGSTLTIILMLGAVFSPGYFKARRGAVPPDPLEFAAVNIALRGRHGRRAWVLTERRAAAVQRTATTLQIGGTRAVITPNGGLEVRFSERTAVLGAPLEGEVVFTPEISPAVAFTLLPGHRWQPIAPRGRSSARLSAPALAFEGVAYHDFNAGSRGLELDFRRWDWLRALPPEGGAAVVYDVWSKAGEIHDLAVRFDADGAPHPLHPLPRRALWPSLWGQRRFARPLGEIQGARRLEDGPFYTRAAWRSEAGGEIVHESLDLRRFARPWVRALLPYRMRQGGEQP